MLAALPKSMKQNRITRASLSFGAMQTLWLRVLLGFMDRDFAIAEISKLFLLDGLKLFPSPVRPTFFKAFSKRVKRNYSLIDDIGANRSAFPQISERSLCSLRDRARAPISRKWQIDLFFACVDASKRATLSSQ
ncbi:hypothetical protein HZH66_011078 [Vespula vulgaris]|uniref:Uncharacterized protein n=1 Tax=Vespula vulgaris TaxID=7454 RepID=A0A834JJI9_VESVU|nr:hypothetical protein HZH66_011078 [Vespula vulgaris]